MNQLQRSKIHGKGLDSEPTYTQSPIKISRPSEEQKSPENQQDEKFSKNISITRNTFYYIRMTNKCKTS